MKHRRTVLGFAAMIVACVTAGAPPASATGGGLSQDATPATDRVADLPTLETQILSEINQLRRTQGLAPLKASAELASAAHEQSLSMAEHGFFGHQSFSGAPFWKRVETKYRKPAGGAWGVGENLVWRSPQLSARRALDLWLRSPPHRQNLLRADWREIGLSAVHAWAAPGVYAGHDVTILTADFGVRH